MRSCGSSAGNRYEQINEAGGYSAGRILLTAGRYLKSVMRHAARGPIIMDTTLSDLIALPQRLSYGLVIHLAILQGAACYLIFY